MEDTLDLKTIDPDSALGLFVSDMEGRDDELAEKALRYGIEALIAVAGKDAK